jgi:alcohol dehydrogenase (cytochrome c)
MRTSVARVAAVLAMSAALATVSELALGAGASDAAPTEWPTYGHDLGNTRYVEFNQINAQNVASLVPRWQYQTGVVGSFEASPIVIGDTMYITTGGNDTVIALDARSGQTKWKFKPKLGFATFCCGPDNRGVAVDGGKVFLATLDGLLYALDARTGSVAWQTTIGDPKDGFSETMAPLTWNGMVFIGSSGGEYGIRGSVTAYAQADGKQVWRWWVTNPGWEGSYTADVHGVSLHRDIAQEKADAPKYADSWKHGGGPVWMTPALDSERGVLYVTTGNPSPQLQDSHRPGDNLYTDSIVALDAKTGEMKWYYQETPHDIWDYDAVSPAVLLDTTDASGKRVPAVAQAGKTCWVYEVNRDDGALIRVSAPFCPQKNMYQHPAPEGSLMEPGALGGNNWSPASYNPHLHYLFTAALVQPRFDKPLPYVEWKEGGARWAGSRQVVPPDVPSYGLFSAVNVDTGEIVWQHRTTQPLMGGSVSVGDLVFVGEGDGHFDAFDAKTGKLLWQYQTGAGISAAPVAYEIDGREYVAVASGGNLLLDTQPGDTLLVFGLPNQ